LVQVAALDVFEEVRDEIFSRFEMDFSEGFVTMTSP
jgi:hypothetical protein